MFPDGSDGKESACNAEDPGLVPESRRSPREANGFSNILAWRIPWTEEPGKLQSMGLQRVGHDSATNTFTFQEFLSLNALTTFQGCSSHIVAVYWTSELWNMSNIIESG